MLTNYAKYVDFFATFGQFLAHKLLCLIISACSNSRRAELKKSQTLVMQDFFSCVYIFRSCT